jgi:uncharacterized protein
VGNASIFLFLLLSLLAEVIGTVGGFGSSVFFVPVASFFLDFHSVLGVTAIFHLSSNISKIALFRKGFDKRLVLLIGIPGVIFVTVGAWLSRYFDNRHLQIYLSLFLIVMSLVLLLVKKVQLSTSPANAIGGGVLSGLTAGLLGTGGAIRGLTLAAFNLEKEVFIATSAIIDLAIDLSRTVVYVANGYVHGHDLYLVAFLFGIGLGGTYLGKVLLKRFSQQQFRAAALILVLITAVVTLVKALA